MNSLRVLRGPLRSCIRVNAIPKYPTSSSSSSCTQTPSRVIGAHPTTYTSINTISSNQIRSYSKKKNSKSSSSSSSSSSNNASETPFQFDKTKWSSKMENTVDRLKKELAGMRMGRSSPALLDPVMVSHRNSKLPLNQVAQVTVKDAQTLLVIPNDEELLTPIEKAIRNANLNLNPQVDQKVLKVPIPKLSKEYRDQLQKSLHSHGEKAKVAIRNARQDARTEIKNKSKKTSGAEDDVKRAEKDVQDLTDKFTKLVDNALASKSKEIASG